MRSTAAQPAAGWWLGKILLINGIGIRPRGISSNVPPQRWLQANIPPSKRAISASKEPVADERSLAAVYAE